MSDDYPLFIPPAPLDAKTPCDFSKEEAEFYSRWVLENQEARVSQFLARFEEQFSSPAEELLLRVGEKVAEALKTPAFTKPTGPESQLSSRGYALAADMGLLLASLFMRECGPSIQWTILREPKTDVSFNCPVLTGFGKLLLDPIYLSVTQSFGVLRGKWGGDAWLRVFRVWKKDAGGAMAANKSH